MKKTIKLINIILIVIIILSTRTNVVFAKSIVQVSEAQDSINLDEYKPGPITGADTFKNIGNTIIGFIQLIGSFVSVIVLIIIGIKYLLGSVEERAQYKETMLPYIIGAVLLFAVTTILKIISDIMSNIN